VQPVNNQETAMATASAHEPLQVIGDYELLSQLGRGGMGTVYRGRHRVSGQVVAVKVVPPEVVADAILSKRFEQEFLVAKGLDHPNIVRALDYRATGREALLVMEYVEGESLGDRLEREFRIPEDEAVVLITQVAQALHHAHGRGLIHRDVKPDNILLTADGQAKLADLGLAKKTASAGDLTRTGRALGTPHFIAPEQLRNAKAADARCDVYSLGATLYQMVTGALPFKASGLLETWTKMITNDLTSPRKLLPRLSERVDRVLRKALNPDPQARQASCRAFVDELLGQEPGPVLPGTAEPDVDVWYVTYEDARGKPVFGVGNARRMQHLLRERVPGDSEAVRAGRVWCDRSRAPSSIPEFQGLTSGRPEVTPAEVSAVALDRPESPEPQAASEPVLDRYGWPVFLAVALAAVVLGFLVFPGK
jgi:eukaryotic-like serine/threonine-protein kinase